MSTQTLYVEWIGPIWQPGITTYKEEILKIGDGPFQTSFDDPRDPDEIESWISTHSGDFSGIDMWRATLIEERSDAKTVPTSILDDSWDRVTASTKKVFAKDVKALTEAEQLLWDETMVQVFNSGEDEL